MTFRKEGGSIKSSGDRVLEKTEGGGTKSAVQGGEEGDYCIVSKTTMRWQQRAAMPSQGDGNFMEYPFRRGCSRKGRVDKYGDIYGMNREFP